MTKYEVAVENRVFTIKFTTNNQGSADTVRDICKKLAEDDKPVPKVKPCPFCGSKYPTVCKTKQKDGWRPFYYVLCDYGNDGCGASGQWNHEEEDAIDAWNRRAET